MVWIVVLAAVIVALWVSRANELFCLSVRWGKVLVVRGRIPGALLADIRTVVNTPMVERATIRGVRREHGAQIVASGDIDPGRVQRLRNIFRLYPLSSLREAQPVARPSLGQILGVAWLAWLFHRRD